MTKSAYNVRLLDCHRTAQKRRGVQICRIYVLQGRINQQATGQRVRLDVLHKKKVQQSVFLNSNLQRRYSGFKLMQHREVC